ncbi:polysaccharide lyase family 7 protein [Vibrio sp. RC27]
MKTKQFKVSTIAMALVGVCVSYTSSAGEHVEPVKYSQFQEVLSESKLQVSDPGGKAGNKSELGAGGNFNGVVSEHFYVDSDSEALIFKMSGYKNRSEVRVLNNFDTSLPNTYYHLSAALMPIDPKDSIKDSDSKNDAMTFLQVHNAGSGKTERGTTGSGYIPHPLLRVVYEGERDGKVDHYWAVIKNNAVNCGSKSGNKGKPECKNAYIKLDLGPVDMTKLTQFDIKVGNSTLMIDVNGETKVDHDISYWSHLNSYFKAGVYNQFKNGTSEVHFNSLEYKVEEKK